MGIEWAAVTESSGLLSRFHFGRVGTEKNRALMMMMMMIEAHGQFLTSFSCVLDSNLV